MKLDRIPLEWSPTAFFFFLLFRLGSVFDDDDGDVFLNTISSFLLHSLFEVLWINL